MLDPANCFVAPFAGLIGKKFGDLLLLDEPLVRELCAARQHSPPVFKDASPRVIHLDLENVQTELFLSLMVQHFAPSKEAPLGIVLDVAGGCLSASLYESLQSLGCLGYIYLVSVSSAKLSHGLLMEPDGGLTELEAVGALLCAFDMTPAAAASKLAVLIAEGSSDWKTAFRTVTHFEMTPFYNTKFIFSRYS